MPPKPNPGKYPVPQYAIRKSGRGHQRTWWPTPEIRADICNQIAEGSSLLSICESPDYPNHQTIFAWLSTAKEQGSHPDFQAFSGQWARACRLRLEAHIEEIAKIEHRLLNTPARIEDPQGRKDIRQKPIFIPNPDAIDVQAARTALESRRWRLSRELPERFGDKSKVEHSGSVKVERPKDHMPEWMKARVETESAKAATDDPAPAPAPQQAEDGPKTVH